MSGPEASSLRVPGCRRTKGCRPEPFPLDGAGQSPMKKVKTGVWVTETRLLVALSL